MRKLYLNRLHGRFVKLVNNYMRDNDCSQAEVARRVGIHTTHLSNIIRQAPNRPLTGYYVLRFISAGIFNMDDIYDGKDETQAEKDFWRNAKIVENHALISIIADLKEAGVDVEGVLKKMHKAIEK